jgi:hypothetical protein
VVLMLTVSSCPNTCFPYLFHFDASAQTCIHYAGRNAARCSRRNVERPVWPRPISAVRIGRRASEGISDEKSRSGDGRVLRYPRHVPRRFDAASISQGSLLHAC